MGKAIRAALLAAMAIHVMAPALADCPGNGDMTDSWGRLAEGEYWVRLDDAPAGPLQLVIKGIRPEPDSFNVRVSGAMGDAMPGGASSERELGYAYMYGFGGAMDDQHRIALANSDGTRMQSPGRFDALIPLDSLDVGAGKRLFLRFEVLAPEGENLPPERFAFEGLLLERQP
ncbi:MAG: hypothetical protein ACPGUC_09550 [Gammaproteobacteria bacterium]